MKSYENTIQELVDKQERQIIAFTLGAKAAIEKFVEPSVLLEKIKEQNKSLQDRITKLDFIIEDITLRINELKNKYKD